jgi:hypothetical protein
MLLPRRHFVLASMSLLTASYAQAEPKARPAFPLGFSLYGMKSLSVADGIAACAKIGYECTELPLLPDWPGDSAKLTDADLRTIRDASEQHKLPILALMENLSLLAADEAHRVNLARLQRATEIARVLSLEKPPLIETILGSKLPWGEAKDAMRARLREWAAIAEKAHVPLCIKAHISNTVRTPEQLAWLLDEVKSDYLLRLTTTVIFNCKARPSRNRSTRSPGEPPSFMSKTPKVNPPRCSSCSPAKGRSTTSIISACSRGMVSRGRSWLKSVGNCIAAPATIRSPPPGGAGKCSVKHAAPRNNALLT